MPDTFTIDEAYAKPAGTFTLDEAYAPPSDEEQQQYLGEMNRAVDARRHTQSLDPNRTPGIPRSVQRTAADAGLAGLSGFGISPAMSLASIGTPRGYQPDMAAQARASIGPPQSQFEAGSRGALGAGMTAAGFAFGPAGWAAKYGASLAPKALGWIGKMLGGVYGYAAATQGPQIVGSAISPPEGKTGLGEAARGLGGLAASPVSMLAQAPGQALAAVRAAFDPSLDPQQRLEASRKAEPLVTMAMLGFIAKNPGKAKELAAKDALSRSDVIDFDFMRGSSAPERESFLAAVRQGVQQYDRAISEAAKNAPTDDAITRQAMARAAVEKQLHDFWENQRPKSDAPYIPGQQQPQGSIPVVPQQRSAIPAAAQTPVASPLSVPESPQPIPQAEHPIMDALRSRPREQLSREGFSNTIEQTKDEIEPQRQGLNRDIEKLGSVVAVAEGYPGKTPVERYARAKAALMYIDGELPLGETPGTKPQTLGYPVNMADKPMQYQPGETPLEEGRRPKPYGIQGEPDVQDQNAAAVATATGQTQAAGAPQETPQAGQTQAQGANGATGIPAGRESEVGPSWRPAEPMARDAPYARDSKVRQLADAWEADALRVIAEKGSTVRAGLDPELLGAYVKFGASQVVKGYDTFATFTKRLTDKFGAALVPHIADVWDRSRKLFEQTSGYTMAGLPAYRATLAPTGYSANEPTGQKIGMAVKGVATAIKDTFAGAYPDTMKGLAGGSVRERNAVRAERDALARRALAKDARMFDGLSAQDKIDFQDRGEKGGAQPTTPLQDAWNHVKLVMDEAVKHIQALGTGKLDPAELIQNYFPRMYKDAAAAGKFFADFAARKPLRGPAGFLKQRTYEWIDESMREARASGLVPVSDNPIEIGMAKAFEMHRYVMGQEIVNELKSRGIPIDVAHGDKAPPGYQILYDEGSLRTRRGNLALPDGAANILKTFMGRGLAGNSVYDGYRWLGNSLNQINLGMSAFHLIGSAINSAFSDIALGGKQLVTGRPLAGLGAIARSPVGPVRGLINGYNAWRAMLTPEAGRTAKQAETAKLIEMGGQRATEDARFLHNSYLEQFGKSLRQSFAPDTFTPYHAGKAMLYSLPAALESSTRGVLYGARLMKMSAYLDMARDVMARNPGADDVTLRRELGKAADSADNRFGQVVYDNVFVNKALKDVGFATVRSLGWSGGTNRELGGGILDTATIAKRIASDRPWMTDRMAYTLSLLGGTAILGGIYQYVRTGQTPQSMKDYFYPRTGNKNERGEEERVSFPTYMKDVVGYGTAPLQTIGNKLHPLLHVIADLVKGEDYFGVATRDKPEDVVHYLKQQLLPFSVRNILETQKSGGGFGDATQRVFGMTPAPARTQRSAAENYGHDVLQALGHGRMTPEQADAAQARRDEIAAGRKDADAETQKLNAQVGTGEVSVRGRKSILNAVRSTPLESLARTPALPADNAIKLWEMATTQERTPALRKAVIDKIKRDMTSLTPKEQQARRDDMARVGLLLSLRKAS